MKRKNVFKGLLISALALVVGFFAIALPFRFFDELSSNQMTMLFVIELASYTGIGLIFLTVRQIEEDRRAKSKEQHEKREAKIKKVQTEWFDLAA